MQQHHINVKMNLSEAQFKKLSKGHITGIKNNQIGHGIDVKLSRANATKALKALKTNKGFRVKLEQHELEGSGFFEQVKRNSRKVLTQPLLTPQMDTALKNIGIKKTVYDVGKPIAISPMVGQGIFGSKFDRMLKRKGIKNIVYKAADAFKPLVHAGIDAAGTLGQAYGIPTAPLTAIAHTYIDHPDEVQAGVRAMTGQGIHKPKLIMRTNSSNIIDSENSNFYPPPMPTFKERQMGLPANSIKGGSLRGRGLHGGSFRL